MNETSMDGPSKTVAFLHEAARLLSKSKLFNAARCNILEKCLDYQRQKEVNLPASHFGTNALCAVCGVNFSDIPPYKQIKPGVKLSRQLKARIKKNVSAEQLPKRKLKFTNKLIAASKQKLVSTCRLCRKKCKTNITKPVKDSKVITPMSETIPKKKKKKKKDPYCGLNKNLFTGLQATSTPHKKKNNNNDLNNSNGRMLTNNKQTNVKSQVNLRKEYHLSKEQNKIKPNSKKAHGKNSVTSLQGKVVKKPKKKPRIDKKDVNKIVNLTNMMQNNKHSSSSLLNNFLKTFTGNVK